MQSEVTQLDFTGKDIFIGIDVHKRQWTITVRFNQMEHTTLSIDPAPEALQQYLHRRYPHGTYHSVYEAGYSGFWIHDALSRFGFKNIVVNPADVPTTGKEKDRKTDRIDSRKLARELENRSLKKGIYIPSVYHQQLRSLSRLRYRLVQDQTRMKCRIKGFLHFNGIPLPENHEMRHWSGDFINWLRGLEFREAAGADYLDICLNSLESTRRQLADIIRRLREHSHQPELKGLIHSQLCSIPGIAFITAITLYSELMDIKRFSSFDHLKSFLGLVPSVSSSDEREKKKGLTNRRNAYLRFVLIEAAWVAVRKDPAMSLAFAELTKRMPKQQAIIRIAKKLLNRIRYVWLNQTTYHVGIVQ